MQLKTKFFIILLVFLALNITVVSAVDVDSTNSSQVDDSAPEMIGEDDLNSNVDSNYSDVLDNASSTDEIPIVKTTPKVSVKSTKVKSRDTLVIYLKNSSGNPLKSKKLTASIGDKKYSITTNSKGAANLNINLAAKTHKLTISFDGDDRFNPITKAFNIKVSKLSTKITCYTNFVVRGNYLYFYLMDQHSNPVSGKKISVKFKGKTYTKKTNKNGRIAFKVKSYPSQYSIKTIFKGDNKFKSSSKTLKFHVTYARSIKIGNSMLLTNGYLRIYLKGLSKSAITKKTIEIKVGNKKFTKKTNSEGIVVIKPKVKAKTYTVTAKYDKFKVFKKVKCVEGNVKDPLKHNVSTRNGVPDIDMMPKSYVMADNNAKYTLTKAQYRDVIKRDSYCLYLNNKLSKYTFFKTKNHPYTNHIIKREKWNVIERAVNAKIVQKNKHNYWPKEITVSLKGKQYNYPEVRDVQSTSYNCGPTSASVCTQVLRNYYCEKYLAKQMGAKPVNGTKCIDIIDGLNKNGFNSTMFHKDSFNNALDELKKGGAALIFHAKGHYVSILDISGDGKKVLVSNSYGSYDNIPSKWIKVSYMKNKFSKWEESVIVRLNYKLGNSTKDSINCFYNSMGTNWNRYNTNQKMGLI
ncbi:hypothetical protein [Methanobrevibacter sp.]|uniref:hypothetical protein n=1 Tax=Methanobrevibacter sp. TaxID=66852 RepID=UPI0038702A2D